MSVIVVVQKNGRAAIGADTAESDDDLVIRAGYIVNHSKLLESGDNIIGLAGWSADAIDHRERRAQRQCRAGFLEP